MITSGILCYVILLFFNHFIAIKADCPFFPRTYLTSGKLANIKFFNDSKECTDNLPKGSLAKCDPKLADVFFRPALFMSNGSNTLPYIDLNITVIGHKYASDVYAQLECLHAPNRENSYCHNHTTPIQKWGRNYWPCRQQRILSKSTDIQLPWIFEHICLRMHGMSQYRIIITFAPQNCQLKYILTLPLDKQLEPEIASLYDNHEKPVLQYPWSPMMTLDHNDDEHIYIKLTPHPMDPTTHVTLSVYQKAKDNTTKLIHDELIDTPEKNVQFHAPAGDYLAFAYVQDPHCHLICENRSNQCHVCHHTFLNFTLSYHHLSGLQSAWKLFTTVMTYLMYLILVLLAFAVITAIGIYVYYQIIRPKRLARLPPEPVEMASRPKVLIIYSDDCKEHTAVVTAFADLLHHHANAQIIIDTHDLTDPSVQPSVWLLKAITDAQFVIIIFSEASPRIMSGETLIPRRPFPEMFNSAVRMVISKINDILAREHIHLQNHNNRVSPPALSKFIISRFSYTNQNVVPEYFSLLPCRRIVIPRDLGLLFGYLHSVDVTQRNCLEYDADLDPINQAILSYQLYTTSHPDWLQSRFQSQHSMESEVHPREAPERLPIKETHQNNDEAMAQIAKKYNLTLPSESDNDDEQLQLNGHLGEKYKLIGNLDDISSASSTEDE